ncbi:pyridoxamine 5'-phosphate oxidase family protein [candidate division WOR-3 bacterium]|nr:pyridoxamine 5'-phosphate oxidase family protein [candidate division WOR-3 bacterium]
MDEHEAKRVSLDLIESAEATYLTSIDEEGFPQTRSMFNLRNKHKFPKLVQIFSDHTNDFMIYFTTNTSSTKINQIKSNPSVCAFFCNPNEFHSLALTGTIEIVDDVRVREALWHEGWERYYPGGPNDPDHTVLRLYPFKARGWYKSQTYSFKIGT